MNRENVVIKTDKTLKEFRYKKSFSFDFSLKFVIKNVA